MPKISGLYWDIGGVLLTNGWDGAARRRAVEAFGVDREEFESRHAEVDTPFELGRLGLEEYLDRLAASRRYLLATLNNESLELNEFRIARFELRRYFSAFFSSCFLGVKKPEAAIYKIALQLAQLVPEEAVFIDDRPLNLECAARWGMRTIHYRDPADLVTALRELGIDA